MQCVYNPEVAKQGVLEVMNKMTALVELATTLEENGTITAEQFNSFYTRYEDIPSYEIDWKVAGIEAEKGHELGNELRAQMQQLRDSIGVNKFIPARFVA